MLCVECRRYCVQYLEGKSSSDEAKFDNSQMTEIQVLEKAKIAAALARCPGVGTANIELMSVTQTMTETTVIASTSSMGRR